MDFRRGASRMSWPWTRRTAVAFVFGFLIVGAFTYQCSRRQYRQTEAYISDCLYGVRSDVLLGACRRIIADRNAGRISSASSNGTVEVNIGGSNVQSFAWLPNDIVWLRPRYLSIHTNYVVVILETSSRRTGFIGFKDGVEQFGTRQVLDGLWFWNGHYGRKAGHHDGSGN